MNTSESISVSTQLPVTLNPAETEIVFNPDTNSYALSLGVKIQLPITELVEVLLKFNQEQSLSHSLPVAEQVDLVTEPEQPVERMLATLPEPTSLTVQEPPPGLGDGSSPVYTPRSCTSDGFTGVSITVVRQEPALLEYRDRAKWTSGKFFTTDAKTRCESNATKLSDGFELFANLPVHSHFLSQVDAYEDYNYHPRTGSMDSTLSSYSMKPPTLSADAPVFTPASAFASTGMPSLDSLRIRAMSDTFADASRTDRAMSLGYLPPSALSVMREGENEWAAPTIMERAESRPAECKQM